MTDHHKKDEQVELTISERQDLWERELIQALEQEMEQEAIDEAGRKRLPSKYEVRIQATWDPVAEETKAYRKLAKEVDNRYDAYMDRVQRAEELAEEKSGEALQTEEQNVELTEEQTEEQAD